QLAKWTQGGGGSGGGVKFAEYPVFFLPDSGVKRERFDIPAVAAVAKDQAPQLVDHDALIGLVLERVVSAQNGASRGVVGVDRRVALAEVADEECASEDAETRGRNCQTPGRVELAVVDAEGWVANSVGVEFTNETFPNPCDAQTCHRVNLRVSDV